MGGQRLNSNGFLEPHLEEIKELHFNQNWKLSQIGKKFKTDQSTIKAFLVRKGYNAISTRKTFDINYFEVIDTKDKAYFLGLLYADGNVYKNISGFKISLQECDSYILDTFRKYLKTDKSLYFKNKQKYRSNWKNAYELEIRGGKIAQDLSDKGCGAQKTFNLKFPTSNQVPDHLIHHFVRGYFDGDGCISFLDKSLNKPRITFCATYDFGLGLKNLLLKELNYNTSFYKAENIYDVRTGSQEKCIKILDWLYQDSDGLRLERKYQRYLQAKSQSITKTKSSEYFGVCKDNRGNKFRATIKIAGKYINIGRFNTEIEAAVAYDNYARLNWEKLTKEVQLNFY